MRSPIPMAKLNSYRELMVWQKSMNLAERCYRMTRRFNRDDQLVLGHEIRKSCVSIPSNIAEGFDSRTKPMFVEFLGRAKASAGELRAQTYVALDVGYLTDSESERLLDEIDKCSRQIGRLMAYVANDQKSERANARTRER